MWQTSIVPFAHAQWEGLRIRLVLSWCSTRLCRTQNKNENRKERRRKKWYSCALIEIDEEIWTCRIYSIQWHATISNTYYCVQIVKLGKLLPIRGMCVWESAAASTFVRACIRSTNVNNRGIQPAKCWWWNRMVPALRHWRRRRRRRSTRRTCHFAFIKAVHHNNHDGQWFVLYDKRTGVRNSTANWG